MSGNFSLPNLGALYISAPDPGVPNFRSRGRQDAIDDRNTRRMQQLGVSNPRAMTTSEELNAVDRQDARVQADINAAARQGRAGRARTSRFIVESLFGMGTTALGDASSPADARQSVQDISGVLLPGRVRKLDRYSTLTARESNDLEGAVADQIAALNAKDVALLRRAKALDNRDHSRTQNRLALRDRNKALDNEADALRSRDSSNRRASRAEGDRRYRAADAYSADARAYGRDAARYRTEAANCRSDAEVHGRNAGSYKREASNALAESQRQTDIAQRAGDRASHMIHKMLHSGNRPPSVSSFGNYPGYADYDPNFPYHTKKYRMELMCDGGPNGALVATSRTHATMSHHEFLLDDRNTYKVSELEVASDGWLEIKVDVTGRTALSDESRRQTAAERRLRGTA